MRQAALSRRPGPFLSGILIGLIGVCAIVVAIEHGAYGPPRFSTEIWVRGADLSAHRGARVDMTGEYGARWSQVCREGCDDVQLSIATSDNSFEVTARDSRGQIIAGPVGAYVTSGYGAGVTRWTVGGDAPFGIQLSDVDRDPDGVVREKVRATVAYDPNETP